MDSGGQLIYHPRIDQNFVNTLSPEEALNLDVGAFEHPLVVTEFEPLRASILNGETGERTSTSWLTVKREVKEKQGEGGGVR